MDWYYASQGQQQGPVSKGRLIELHRAGELLLSDLVWNEGMSDWAPLGTLPELAGETSLPTMPEPPPSPPPASPAATAVGGSATPNLARASHLNPADRPPTYLWQSIVCLIFCCLPLSIPALIFACRVEPAFLAGDLAGAQEASRKARLFCLLAFFIGLVGGIAYIGLVIFGTFAEMASEL